MQHGGGGGGPKHEGHGQDFRAAADNAAEKAKNAQGPGKYVVDEIEVDVVNPIRDYKVVLVKR
jgi:hypothetical protein